jgi:hypothetical protein
MRVGEGRNREPDGSRKKMPQRLATQSVFKCKLASATRGLAFAGHFVTKLARVIWERAALMDFKKRLGETGCRGTVTNHV